MPRFTIDLSAGAVAGIKTVVDRYNADNGTALTVQEWLILHIKEIAIQDALVQAARTLQEQAEKDAAAAIKAERDRLLDSMA